MAVTLGLSRLSWLRMSSTLSWSNLATNKGLPTPRSLFYLITFWSCTQWSLGYIFIFMSLMSHAMHYSHSWHFSWRHSTWLSCCHLLLCSPLHMHLVSIPGSNYWLYVPNVKVFTLLLVLDMRKRSVQHVRSHSFYQNTRGKVIVRSRVL